MAIFQINSDDIFISYCRSDARTYTDGLANELTKKGFSCFTDALGTDAGAELPETLIKKLKTCAMQVVIGSKDALQSVAVGREIELFSQARGTARIILIEFDDAISSAPWNSFVTGLRRERDLSEALVTGNPATGIVNRIEKAFAYRKSKDRLKRYTRTAGIILGILIVAIVIATFIANKQLQKAALQQKIANSLDLANESQVLLENPAQISESLEKAIQSMEIDASTGQHSFSPDFALRSSLSFFPDFISRTNFPERAVFFTSGGTTVIVKSSDTLRQYFKPGEDRPFFEQRAEQYTPFAVAGQYDYVATGYTRSVSITRVFDKLEKIHSLDENSERSVSLLAISPNGRYVVIVYRGNDAGDFDTMEMWDTQMDSTISFPLSAVNVNSISFSANGKTLAMGCRGFDARGAETGVALLWDMGYIDSLHFDEDQLSGPYRHEQPDPIDVIAPGDDYSYFASSQRSNIVVRKLGVGNQYYPYSYIPTTSTVYDLVFKDEQIAVIESMKNDYSREGNSLSIWNYNGYDQKDNWFTDASLVTYDHNTNELLSFSGYITVEEKSQLFCWQSNIDSPVTAKGTRFESEKVLYHSNDQQYFITRSDSLHIWQQTQLKYAAAYDNNNHQFNYFNFSDNGKWLSVVKVDKNNNNDTGVVLNLKDNRYQKVFSFIPKARINSMEVSRGRLFVLDIKGDVYVYDLGSKDTIPSSFFIHNDSLGIESFATSSGGHYICLGERLYNASTSQTTYRLAVEDSRTGKVDRLSDQADILPQFVWLPNSETIVIAYGSKVHIMDMDDKQDIVLTNAGVVNTLSFSPSGNYFGFGTETGSIRVFSSSTKTEVCRINTSGRIIDLAFSNDDRYVAASINNSTFLGLNAEPDYSISTWVLNSADLIAEGKRRLRKITKQ